MNLDQDYTFGGSADRQPTLNSTFENEFSRAEWERRYSPKRARHHTDFFCDAPEARRVALAGDFNRWDAVRSKTSCGFCVLAVVESEQASESLAGADFTRSFPDPIGGLRKQNHVVLALMVPFGVKMRNII